MKRMHGITLSLMLAGLCVFTALPAQRLTLAFYNTENMYDTVPSLFYDDGDHTPQGRLSWDTAKYRAKLANIARVIDAMSADVIGLSEVENEAVLRDLVSTITDDYNYIHHTGSDRRGMDMALLYRGDRFVPLHSKVVRQGPGRELLHVRGELSGQAVELLVCHMPSQFNTKDYRQKALASLYGYADSLSTRGSGVVVMGDFNAAPSDRAMRRTFRTGGKGYDPERVFFSPFESIAAKGMGSYAYDGRWQMLDNIFLSLDFLSGTLRYSDRGIFVREWMLSADPGRRSYPLRTFSAGRYTGGYSDHLPVYVVLDVIAK